MRICEIFQSIQGEGALTGVPSVFVRTSGCNLRCTWCDTPYASSAPEGEEMEVGEILGRVLALPASHVVLTGGEPMIAKGISELAVSLRENGKHVTVETAGTVPPRGIACDLASLSPKLANSTPAPGQFGAGWTERHEARRLQPEVVAEWIENYEFQLKFVVSSPDDIAEIDEFLGTLPVSGIPPWRIQLMPEGTGAETLRSRRDWLVETCLERGFRCCQRLQIELFGNTRGV